MTRIIAKKRHPIRKSQVQSIYSRLREQIGDSEVLFECDRMEIVETNTGIVLYLVDKKPLLMEHGGILFPTLKGILEHPFPQRRIVVDAGAVPYVVNGADIMRPGIVSLTDDIRKGLPVQVVEVRHGKPIALGIALYDSDELRERESGKVVKNIHRVGDEVWNIEI